ncbi:MAG: hypothetical protein NVSMB6_05480 [Burkholderiaceae bacterium]
MAATTAAVALSRCRIAYQVRTKGVGLNTLRLCEVTSFLIALLILLALMAASALSTIFAAPVMPQAAVALRLGSPQFGQVRSLTHFQMTACQCDSSEPFDQTAGFALGKKPETDFPTFEK